MSAVLFFFQCKINTGYAIGKLEDVFIESAKNAYGDEVEVHFAFYGVTEEEKRQYEERKSVLLLIDEAQRLKHDLMEEIRLLSNLERQNAKLLNIFFVGQNEFNSILLQPENRALMRRITVTCNGAGQLREGWAEAVDRVWHHFLIERFKPFVESGEYLKK